MRPLLQLFLAGILFLLSSTGISAMNEHPDAQSEALLQVIRDISERYNVHFTYDREIVENVKVKEYEPDTYVNVEDALRNVLKGTNLKYVMLEMKYVIIYQDDEKGMKSLEQMVGVLQKIIEQKKEKRLVSGLDRLQSSTDLSSIHLKKHRVVLNVSGTVTNQSGEPLIGVNILVKGTNKGTATDFEGRFSLEDVNENATLVFSYVGYQTREVEVSGRPNIDIVLKEDAAMLDEVVVVGYGSQSLAKVTTAISRIDTKKIENTSYSNMGAALSGLTQGILLKQSGSGPGNDIPSISIRGGGEPLYVIDGIISNKLDFVRLNSSDIENISILKDAGSTSVYGSRAANGVVLVSTKNAQDNKISYSNNFSWGALANQPEYLNAYEYVQFYNRMASVWGFNAYSQEEVQKWKNGTEPGYKSTNFWGESFKKYSPSQRHNLTIQGKEKNSDYLVSLSTQNQGSRYLYKDAHYQNVYNVLAKIGKTFDELGLRFDGTIRGVFADYNSTVWDYYYMMTRTNEALPIWQPFNSEGNYTIINGIYNPFYMQDPENGYNYLGNRRYVGTGSVKWDVPKVNGLDVSLIGNYETFLDRQKTFTKLQPFYDSNNEPIFQELPSLFERRDNSRNYTIQAFLNYKNTFGKHSIAGSAIYEEYEYIIWRMAASRKDYLSEV